MCLLIACKGGTKIPEAHLRESAKRNRDGFGWAIRTSEGLITYKGMKFEEVWAEWEKLRERYPEQEALWHLRFATHGAEDQSNCHPFYLGNDPLKQTLMAHNGVLNVIQSKDDRRSDTSACAEDIMAYGSEHAEKGIISIIEDQEEWEQWLGGGNKMAFLSVNPAVPNLKIFNEKAGEWKDDIWYSNNSWQAYEYKWSQVNYSGYSKYSEGSEDWKAWGTRQQDAAAGRVPAWVNCDTCGVGFGHMSDCTKAWKYTKNRDQNRLAQAASVFATASECPNCHLLVSAEDKEYEQCPWCSCCMLCSQDIETCDCEPIMLWDEQGLAYSTIVTKEENEKYQKELDEETDEAIDDRPTRTDIVNGEIIDMVYSYVLEKYIPIDDYRALRKRLLAELEHDVDWASADEEDNSQEQISFALDAHSEVLSGEDIAAEIQRVWEAEDKKEADAAWEEALQVEAQNEKRSRLYVAHHAQIIPIHGVPV